MSAPRKTGVPPVPTVADATEKTTSTGRRRCRPDRRAACLPNLRLGAKWVSRMLSEGDGTPSTKRVCFVGTTGAAIGLCFGLFMRHGFEALAVDLMKWALTAAGTAYGITRLAEYGSDTGQAINNQPTTSTPPTQ